MPDFIKTQNNFANGEVSPEFYSHDNLNGLMRLENMDVMSGGGLKRRDGLKVVNNIPSDARLVPFSVAEDEEYLLVLGAQHIYVYRDDKLCDNLLSPWNINDLAKLQYAQRFGTMIFVHPEFRPMVLKKYGEDFELIAFDFARNDENMNEMIPFMRFEDSENITITISANSAGNNFATLTTNRDFWTPDSVGSRVLVQSRQWLVDTYIDATHVRAYTNGAYSASSGAISDWGEAAFSNRRGWPCSITFHQDRLVFGGSRDYPSGIWLSKVGHHNNFDAGTGLDDEAIFITLLSQQRQHICTVVSSDNLQILTSVGEWAISNKPLTPSSVEIKQHTSVGSVASRYLPPQKIEGATVFISSGRKDIRELTLDELGENYNAADLCAYSKHLMQNPIDIAYNDSTRQLFVVLENGDVAVLNQNSALGISAWGVYKTQGDFRSVAVLDGTTYVIVRRDEIYNLEKFQSSVFNDAGQYGFSFNASALPIHSGAHDIKKYRIRKISVRVLNTKSIEINGMRVSLPNEIYAPDSDGYSGDISVNILGSVRNKIASPWVISGSEQLPTTVLSVAVHGFYTI